jgi:hypothetical protein
MYTYLFGYLPTVHSSLWSSCCVQRAEAAYLPDRHVCGGLVNDAAPGESVQVGLLDLDVQQAEGVEACLAIERHLVIEAVRLPGVCEEADGD